MKKKIVLFSMLTVILFTGVFVLTGCGNNEITAGDTSDKNVANEFSVKGVSFKFDKDSTFNDLKYKNSEGLEPDESKKSCYLTYKNQDIYEGRYVFRIVMMCMENTTIEDEMSENERNNNESTKINGIDWTVFHEESENTKVIIHATEVDNKVYAVYVQKYKDADVDIDTLADIFMNGINL